MFGFVAALDELLDNNNKSLQILIFHIIKTPPFWYQTFIDKLHQQSSKHRHLMSFFSLNTLQSGFKDKGRQKKVKLNSSLEYRYFSAHET